MGDVDFSASTFKQRAERHLLHYGCAFADFVPARASGCYLYDASGARMLDFTSGQMSAILGHSPPGNRRHHPRRRRARSITCFPACMSSEPVINLAEAAGGLQVPALPRVMLLSTGGEANEAAIKIAKTCHRQLGDRRPSPKSWHGMTGRRGRRHLQGRPSPAYGPMPASAATSRSRRRTPTRPRFPGVSTGRRELDDGFEHDRPPRAAATWPLSSPSRSSAAAASWNCPMGYLRRAENANADERGMLLILDEAQTGLGRTGTMFAFERDGVVPDILTLSKTLGAGMALSAVMTNDKVAAAADDRQFFFYTTHVNDPLPAAVGLKVLEIVLRDRLTERARQAGEYLAAGLLRLKQRHACIGDVRGRGLLRGLEFTNVGSRDATSISNAVTEAAMEIGLAANLVRSGTAGGTMRIAPPLTVQDAELDEGLDLLDRAIGKVVAA